MHIFGGILFSMKWRYLVALWLVDAMQDKFWSIYWLLHAIQGYLVDGSTIPILDMITSKPTKEKHASSPRFCWKFDTEVQDQLYMTCIHSPFFNQQRTCAKSSGEPEVFEQVRIWTIPMDKECNYGL